MGMKYFTDAGIECTPGECKLIESLNRLAKKWEKDGKRLWLYSASGDEGFEEYKKFLSDPDQKKFCFKGYYYVEVKEQDDKELLGAMGRVVYE